MARVERVSPVVPPDLEDQVHGKLDERVARLPEVGAPVFVAQAEQSTRARVNHSALRDDDWGAYFWEPSNPLARNLPWTSSSRSGDTTGACVGPASSATTVTRSRLRADRGLGVGGLPRNARGDAQLGRAHDRA